MTLDLNRGNNISQPKINNGFNRFILYLSCFLLSFYFIGVVNKINLEFAN